MSFEPSKFPIANKRLLFSAYADSTAQAGTASTDTKVTFNQTRWNNDSIFNTSDSTFTPTVAGYFLLEVQLPFTAANSGYLAIYKNNSIYKIFDDASTSRLIFKGTALVDFNGTTDNAHIVMNLNSPTGVVNSSEPLNWFNGYIVFSS